MINRKIAALFVASIISGTISYGAAAPQVGPSRNRVCELLFEITMRAKSLYDNSLKDKNAKDYIEPSYLESSLVIALNQHAQLVCNSEYLQANKDFCDSYFFNQQLSMEDKRDYLNSGYGLFGEKEKEIFMNSLKKIIAPTAERMKKDDIRPAPGEAMIDFMSRCAVYGSEIIKNVSQAIIQEKAAGRQQERVALLQKISIEKARLKSAPLK